MTTARIHHPKSARSVMTKLAQMYGTPEPSAQTEPIEQLVLAILARNDSPSKAQAVLQRIKNYYVDFNELRVSSRSELVKQFGTDIDQASAKAKEMIASLRGIFDRENTFELGFLKAHSKRELETYFSDMPTVDNYLLNSLILNCCSKQAFPLDQKMVQACKDLKLADGEVTLEGMQAYFERQLKAAQSYAFCYMLKQFSVKEPARTQAGKAKKKATKKTASKKRTTVKKKTAPRKTTTKKKTSTTSNTSRTAKRAISRPKAKKK